MGIILKGFFSKLLRWLQLSPYYTAANPHMRVVAVLSLPILLLWLLLLLLLLLLLFYLEDFLPVSK